MSSEQEKIDRLAALRGFNKDTVPNSSSDNNAPKNPTLNQEKTTEIKSDPSLSHYDLCTQFIKRFRQFIKEDGVHADDTNYKKLSLLNSAIEINLSQLLDKTILIATIELYSGPENLSDLAKRIASTDPESAEYKEAAAKAMKDNKEYESINKFINKIYKHSDAYVKERDLLK